jgi:hypothetical protein
MSFKKLIIHGLGSIFLLFFLLFLSSPFAFASSFRIENYSSVDSSKIDFPGDFIGGQFGSIIKSGDFSGNNFNDLAIGAPFSSTSSKHWNGSLTLVLNSPDNQKKISFFGENSGDQLGTSVAFGDFNGNGFDDIAIGAHSALDGNARKGKVYILYGGNNLIINSAYPMSARPAVEMTSQFGDSVLSKANFVLDGQVDKGQFGVSLSTADLNKNGFEDLIVGAPEYSSDGKNKNGAVYIYFGTKNGLKSTPDITIYGESDNEKFGSSFAVGNFDGNGSLDLAVGAYTAVDKDRQQIGKVYFYKDIASKTSKIYTSDSSLTGYYEKSWFGFSLDAADINNNGFDDLLVSSFPYAGHHRNAGVYLYYGASNFFYKSVPDVVIDDFLKDSLAGATVLLRDFNGDGKKDIIIGSPGIKHLGGKLGKVYIVFSGKDQFQKHYNVRNSFGINIVYGEAEDDWFGYSLEGVDFTGNSMNDLVVGARYANIPNGINIGKIFLFPGENKPFGKIAPLANTKENEVTRAELIKIVFDSFNLRNARSDFFESCYEHKEFCLFNFSVMSSFNDFSLEPEMILYPDVQPEHPYYDYINEATMLGIINGYLGHKNSPFLPDYRITRIQALKVILSATNLVPHKYKFELIEKFENPSALSNQSSYFSDINPRVDSMWWMPRYVNFAVENGIIEEDEYFMPNEPVSLNDLNTWILNTLLLLKSQNEKVDS